MKRKLTLAERAVISRRMAAEHRALAASTIAMAEQMERDAELMERGIDPFAKRWVAS
jgi:hypothetical protein